MRIQMIGTDRIDEFLHHPFRVTDDADMTALKSSIARLGIRSPLLLRKKENGRFELISGHRRLFAAKALGNASVPAIVYSLDQDGAVLNMVDANLHRTNILPSEQALAFKMKFDILKSEFERKAMEQGSGKPVSSSQYRDYFEKQFGISYAKIRRIISLTNLCHALMELVDEKKISVICGAYLSTLSVGNQKSFCDAYYATCCQPTLSQVIAVRKLSEKEKLTPEKIIDILEKRKDESISISFSKEEFSEFFSPETSADTIQKTILKSLELYKRMKERKREREQEILPHEKENPETS